MDPRSPLSTALDRPRHRPRLRPRHLPGHRLRRVTGSITAGGMMMAGMPLALEYVVRPGDTLSEIAARHDSSVERLVSRNDLDDSGDRIVAGETLVIPGQRGSGSASASEGRTADPDARRIVRYTVRPGDTPSGLAVRFHAWTAELIARNGSLLRVGERIEIPVVVAAVQRERRTSGAQPTAPSSAAGDDGSSPSTDGPGGPTPGATAHGRTTTSDTTKSTTTSGPSRTAVRRAITAAARRHGVDPNLALAVSWQEAGWQMHHVSPAGAVGAMQVMPSTGRWMSSVLGTPLDLRDVHDNAAAGVTLLGMLQQEAGPRRAVAGYYQGLTGVRRHGMYPDTKRYVANVLALKSRFDAGDYPG